MKALILAGGFGKRLRPLTEDIPKPLVKINNKTILEYLISLLKKHGIDEIILALGYRGEKILEYVKSGKKFGIKVAYCLEEEPLGTGGAIKNASHILKKEELFVVMNGDIITNIPISQIIDFMKENEEYIGAIALVKMKSPYGVVELEEEKIVKFIEKPILNHWINAGIYVFRNEIFDYLPDVGDIEKSTFLKLAIDGKLAGIKFENIYWKSIDTLKDFEEVSKELSNRNIINSM